MGAYWISAITPKVKLGVEVVVVKRLFLLCASFSSRVDRRGDLREAFSLILQSDDVYGGLTCTCWIECECECEWKAKAADNARCKQRARNKRDFDECNRKGMNECFTRTIRLIRLYSVVQTRTLNTWVGGQS